MNFANVEIDFYQLGIGFYHCGNRLLPLWSFLFFSFFPFFFSPRGHSINQMEIQKV